MNILAINTAKKGAKIGTSFKGVVNTYNSPNNASHSESLLTTLDEVLKSNNLSVKDLNVLGVVIGPGSFTGIRIGVSVVKAFMFNSGLKAVAVNSFEEVAYNIKSKYLKNNYFVAINADSKGAYVAEIDHKTNKTLQILPFNFLKLREFLKTHKNVYVSKNQEEFFKNNQIELITVQVEENSLINLIKEKAENEEYVKINDLEPLYVKLSQAENQFLNKLKLGFKIEQIENEDVNELIKIEKESFTSSVWTKESFEAEFNKVNRYLFKAVYNKEVLGFVVVWHTPDNMFNLLNLAVKKEFRKLGIANKLMHTVLNLAKEKGVDKFFLEVAESNASAINLYKKFGFEQKSIRKKYYDNGENAIIMFLDIK